MPCHESSYLLYGVRGQGPFEKFETRDHLIAGLPRIKPVKLLQLLGDRACHIVGRITLIEPSNQEVHHLLNVASIPSIRGKHPHDADGQIVARCAWNMPAEQFPDELFLLVGVLADPLGPAVGLLRFGRAGAWFRCSFGPLFPRKQPGMQLPDFFGSSFYGLGRPFHDGAGEREETALAVHFDPGDLAGLWVPGAESYFMLA